MTISSTTTSVAFTGDGVTTAFATGFVFFGADEIEVVERVIATGVETVKTLTTHYTVSGGNGSTGTVTAVSPPASTVQWHIRRKTNRLQEADYTPNDPFPAETHERALDRAAARDQEIDADLARTPKFPKTDPSGSIGDLPSSVERASKYLGFDSAGKPAVFGAPTNTSLTTSFSESLLAAATAAEARTTLGALGGSLGATDNVVPRTDGTGGKTLQNSVMTIGDTGAVAVSGAGAALSVQLDDDGSSGGPTLTLFRNSASPAVNDQLGGIVFSGKDDAGNTEVYGSIAGRITDPTNGSEDGRFVISPRTAGGFSVAHIFAAGYYSVNATGGDQGVDTINAAAFYENGRRVYPAGCWGYVTYSGGTPTLADSHNVTSITDAGTGNLTVTVATDFANANYALTALCNNTNLLAGPGDPIEIAGTRAVGAFGVGCYMYNSPTLGDPGAINFAAFGDI